MDSAGNRLSTFAQISQEAISFFQKLLGEVDPKIEGCSQVLLTELLQGKLSAEATTELIKPVTSEEIKTTMFAINEDKAPRPDGYTSKFFKSAWSIVAKDMVCAVRYFFQTSKLLLAFNSTIVALVQKCQNPCSIKDYGQFPTVL